MPTRRAKNAGPPRFTFTVPLRLKEYGSYSLFLLEIPPSVTKTLGRRGPIPIVATLNKSAELQASLVPMGNGRHRLQLNSRIRAELGLTPGDPVRVDLRVPEKPPRQSLPTDLAQALREADLQNTFDSLPVGKQNHIIFWIEQSARPQTRANRIDLTLQVAYRARERAYDRRIKSKGARA